LTKRTQFLEKSAVDGSGLSEQHRISSVYGADMQPGRQPWVQQNSERDSEGNIKQLFTWLSCCCMKLSLFYLDIHASTCFHLCFTIVT